MDGKDNRGEGKVKISSDPLTIKAMEENE